jgi:hypothetical protein
MKQAELEWEWKEVIRDFGFCRLVVFALSIWVLVLIR